MRRRLRFRLLALVGVATVAALIGVSVANAAVQKGYTSAESPATESATGNLEIDTRFSVSANNVQVVGAQFYQSAGEPSGSHTVKLWDGTGALLASTTVNSNPGWNEVFYSTPIDTSNGGRYITGYGATTKYGITTGTYNRPIGSLGVSNQGATSPFGVSAQTNVSQDMFIGPILDVRADPAPPAPYTGPSSTDFNAAATAAHNDALAAASASLDEQARLDLAWWGAWAAVGVLLALLVVPRVFSRFKFGEF